MNMNETKVPGVTLGGNMNGTCLQGYLTASYADLVALLGEPNAEGDGYKVSTEWELTFEGQTFTLYDYKETNLYDDSSAPSPAEFRARPSYDWHVGAQNNTRMGRFLAAMSEALRVLPKPAAPEPKRTERGFRIFEESGEGPMRLFVVESSRAFAGAFVRVYHGEGNGNDDIGEHVQLSVAEAEKVRNALDTFIAEARAGKLTEPAEVKEE